MEQLDRVPNPELPSKVIFACFENADTLSPESREKIDKIKKGGINIDWYARHDELSKGNMMYSGEGTYVISPVNNEDKYSEEGFLCLEIVAVGRNNVGENISFISHQDPDTTFVKGIEEKFNSDLAEHFKTLQEQTVRGSVDVIFLGGEYPITKSERYPNLPIGEYWDTYEKSISKMRDLVLSLLQFEPTIITGPKTHMGDETKVYFSTHDRRLYVVQYDYTLGHAGQASDIRRLYKK